MKAKTIIVAACISLTFGLASCSDAEKSQILASNQNNEEIIVTSKLGKVLQSVVEASNHEEDSYILYDASSDAFISMTASEYELANAFATLVVREKKSITRVPAGQGWKVGGTGKDKLDAMTIAHKIIKKLPDKQNFEIRVEYNDDGSYTVYYREV